MAAVPSPRFQRAPVNWRANIKSSGAHPPKKNGRAARVTTPVPATSPAFPVIAMAAPAKCATPGYAAGGKAVMLKFNHQSA